MNLTLKKRVDRMKFILFFLFSCLSLLSFAQNNSKIIFPYLDSVGSRSHQLTKLDAVQWNTMGFDLIEPYHTTFEYSILLSWSKNDQPLLIVQRTSTDEEYRWICLMNKENKVEAWLVSAYDNSEGFLNVKSIIQEDSILINTWNLYPSPNETTENYTINEEGFIKTISNR